MRSKILVLALVLAGCIPHAADRAKNATTDAAYGAALDDCYQKAVETFQTMRDSDIAQDQYEVCAKAADAKFGKK